MLREVRKVRGDPQVLAAQSREQYFKVILLALIFYGALYLECFII